MFEIKFHSPKDRNALTGQAQALLTKLFTIVNDDKNIKCVVIHGGKYYGSGNNLKILANNIKL